MPWNKVKAGDEYAEQGDTVYADMGRHSYYFNEKRKVVRRYSLDGTYCERNSRKPGNLARERHLFSQAKYDGRLINVQGA